MRAGSLVVRLPSRSLAKHRGFPKSEFEFLCCVHVVLFYLYATSEGMPVLQQRFAKGLPVLMVQKSVNSVFSFSNGMSVL